MKRPDRRPTYQTYPDGWGTSWRTEARKLVEVRQACVHYAETAVGERRYWDAKNNKVELTKAVLVPYEAAVEQGDIFYIGEEQYLVEQKDRRDTLPTSWLLSLSRPPIAYKMKVVGSNG